MRAEIPIGRREAVGRSRFISAQQCVNCYLERDPEPGVPDALIGGPGLVSFATCGTGPIRGGAQIFGSVSLVVSALEVYTVTSAGAATLRGTIEGTDDVIIAHNGAEAVIVSEEAGKGWIWNGTTLTQITDADFFTPSSVDFIDQYMIFSRDGTGNYYISALANAASYDALDIASAEAKPDGLVRVMVDNQEVLLFGEESLEGRYNSGNADFPFDKTQLFINYGLAGKMAVTQIDNTVGWLASDFKVRLLRGGSPQVISDDAIAATIQSWSSPGATRFFTLQFGNHEMLVARHADGCLIWDAQTQLWHRRKSYGSETWRVVCGWRQFGKQLLGDGTNGTVWELSPTTYSEGGTHLVRELVSKTLGPAGQPFTLHEVEVFVECGVGLTSGQGSDPTIWAEFSRDGGYEWGSRIERSIGARGDRELRVVFEDLGPFPPAGGVIKLAISDPVPLTITRAFADYTQDRA